MVHYGFYQDQYLGNLIPEKEFPGAMQRAQETLERFRRIFQVESAGTVSEQMALCAMAEAVYTASKRAGGVAATSVGKVSVRYGDAEPLQRQLLRKAAIYLDIKRGVS